MPLLVGTLANLTLVWLGLHLLPQWAWHHGTVGPRP